MGERTVWSGPSPLASDSLGVPGTAGEVMGCATAFSGIDDAACTAMVRVSCAPAQDTRTIAVQAASSIPENAVAQPITSPAVPGTPKESEAKGEGPLHTVRSPIVGTFYESPSPGSPPFVKPGDAVEVGQVLCIVEAMKLMNEIESDVAGEVVKKLVANGQPIEYGQELFVIRPKS